MRNVLSDFLERIQRRSVGEQVGSRSLILPTRNYNSIIWKNTKEEAHSFVIRLGFINLSAFGFNQNFGSIFSSKGKTYAFIGTINIKNESNEFSENVSTSLVKILFENSLGRGLTVEKAILEVEKVFDISQFFCFEISSNINIKLYNHHHGKNIKKNEVVFSEKKICHVHTFDSEVGKALDKVITHIKSPHSLQVFIRQISNESGAILLVHPK